MTSKQRLIIGIDYGTSNSGAAYAIVDEAVGSSNVDIEVIKSWPHSGTSHYASDKVPSDIAYGRDKQPVGYGFDIPSGAQPLQWVKLLLEPDDLKHKSSNNASRVWKSYEALDSKALNKQPVDAVTDYLRWLWQRIRLKIEEDEDDEDLFNIASLTVVLTVPASWSERAKNSMARAAKAAGIPERAIKLVSEPEAAAIFSLKKQAKKRQIVQGDCIIIVDAGGGTVDLVAYQVHCQEPLSLDQVTVSTGDFCGSAFIDAEFHSQVRSILGEDFNRLDAETRGRIEDEFEYKIKRTYNPDEPRTYYIPVTGLEDDEERGISAGKLRIDEAVLSAAFESVMTPIMSLIDKQRAALREKGLEQDLKGILLVGGFSGSDYLHSRVKEEFPGKNDIKIWRGDKTWTAVVQGAVACEASGNENVAAVHSRLSSYNYGIPYATESGRKVQWLVRKGQAVQTNMSTEPYGLRIDDQDWLDHDKHCHIMVPLVRSEDNEASDEYTASVTPHAEIDCKLPTSLRYSKEARLVQEVPRKAWHIPAHLVLFLDGAVISFRCRIQDQEVGVTDVTYFREITEEQDLRRTSLLSTQSFVDSVISNESEGSGTVSPGTEANGVNARGTVTPGARWTRAARRITTWTRRSSSRDAARIPLERAPSSTNTMASESSSPAPSEIPRRQRENSGYVGLTASGMGVDMLLR